MDLPVMVDIQAKPRATGSRLSSPSRQSKASSSTSSRRSTSSTKITMASASAIHAPRDIVNRQPKHIQNAQTHASTCNLRFFV